MKPKPTANSANPTDVALLESALLAIEKVLAHADSNSQEAPYEADGSQAAANVCLSAAAALVDVSRTLINTRRRSVSQDSQREWEAMITYTKIASRSAHRAALMMAAQQSAQAAHYAASAEPGEHAESADGGEHSAFAALSG